MRTTLTIEAPIAEQLQREMHVSGKSFKEVLNECLQRGLRRGNSSPEKPAFQVKSRRMGQRSGLNLDNIGELLEQIEGPAYK